MSYESTLHYYERINKQVNSAAGGLTSAQLIIYNVNFEAVKALMDAADWDKLGEEMADIALTLEKAGADFVVIATNTMHKVADFVQSKITVPLIHIADCVADKCKESSVSKVGLLGTSYTMTETFLTDRLADNCVEALTPEKDEKIREIDRIIFDELCKGEVRDESRAYFVAVIDEMIEKHQIEGVIFGCTEIEMLVKAQDLRIPIFDTTQAHIDAIVEHALLTI